MTPPAWLESMTKPTAVPCWCGSKCFSVQSIMTGKPASNKKPEAINQNMIQGIHCQMAMAINVEAVTNSAIVMYVLLASHLATSEGKKVELMIPATSMTASNGPLTLPGISYWAKIGSIHVLNTSKIPSPIANKPLNTHKNLSLNKSTNFTFAKVSSIIISFIGCVNRVNNTQTILNADGIANTM